MKSANRKRKTDYGLAIGIVLVAFAILTHNLDERSLWEDEGHSYFGSSWSIEWTLHFLIADAVHPPLYYLIQKLSFPLGASEFAMRFPAAIFGLLSVAAVGRIGRHWLGRPGGLLASALVAVSPFAVAYGREARMYSLVMLLTIGAVYEFWRFVNYKPWSTHRLASISMALYFTHYFGVFVGLIQFLFLLISLRRNHPRLRWWILAQGIASAPLALWLISLFNYGAHFKIGWIRPPQWDVVLLTLSRYVVGFAPAYWLIIVVGLSLIVTAGLFAQRNKEWSVLLAIWVILPPLATYAISLRRPLYVDRYLIGILPGIMLALSAGVIHLTRWRRAASLFALAILLPTMLWRTVLELRLDTCVLCVKENWRGAAHFVIDHEQASDTLLIRSIFNFGMNYYYRGQLKMQPMDVGWLPETASALAGRQMWVIYRGTVGPAQSPDEMESANFYQSEPDRTMKNWLYETRGYIVEWRDFGGVTVLHYDFSGVPSLEGNP